MPLPERIAALIAASKRFGKIFPTFGVKPTPDTNNWICECPLGASCGKNTGKHPRVKWKTEATGDPGKVARFAKEFPLANWGATYKDDILDLDNKPGKPNGVANFQKWEAVHGAVSTLRISTGTGQHLRFKAGTGLRQSKNGGLGIDVRSAEMGYVVIPGSRHQNGNVYRVVEDRPVAACPAWLSRELYGNQQDTKISQSSVSTIKKLLRQGAMKVPGKGRGRGRSKYQPTENKLYAEFEVTTPEGFSETTAFHIDVDAKLTVTEWGLIDALYHRRAEFAATWCRDRGPQSRFPFRGGDDSDSEYEGSISLFLRSSGWSAQAIMNAIAVWNRMHHIQLPAYASRYGATIATAFSIAKLYGDEPAPARTKGCWTWGGTKARILAALEAGPRHLKQIADELDLTYNAVQKAVDQLVASGLVLHAGHEYLRTPDEPGEIGDCEGELEAGNPVGMDELEAMEAEFQEYLARMEAGPEFAGVFAEPTALVDDAEPEPVLVTVQPAPANRVKGPELVLSHRQAIAARLRENRKRPNYFSPAALKREAKAKKLIRKRELEQEAAVKWLLEHGTSVPYEPPAEHSPIGIFD
jgi:biotin operon repressor